MSKLMQQADGSLYATSARQSNLSVSRWSSDVTTTVDDVAQQADVTAASSYSVSSARQVLGRASIDARRRSPHNLAEITRTTTAKSSRPKASFGNDPPPPIDGKVQPSLASSFFDVAPSYERVSNGYALRTSSSTESFVTTFDQRQSMQSERSAEGRLHASQARTKLQHAHVRRPSTIKEHTTPVKRSAHLKSRFSVSPRHQKPLPPIAAYRDGRHPRRHASPAAAVKRKAVPSLSPEATDKSERHLPVPPREHSLTAQKSFASIRVALASRNAKVDVSHAPQRLKDDCQKTCKSEVRFPYESITARTSTDFLRAMETEKRNTVVIRGSWIDVQKESKDVSSVPNGGSGWWSKLRSRRKSLFSRKSSKQRAEPVPQEEVPRRSCNLAPVEPKAAVHSLPLPNSPPPGALPSAPSIRIDEAAPKRNSLSSRRMTLRPLQLHAQGDDSTTSSGSVGVGVGVEASLSSQVVQKIRHARIKSRNLSISLPYLSHKGHSDVSEEAEEEEEETMNDMLKPVDDQNVTQKTVSSSILDLDDTLEAKKRSRYLSAKFSSPVQFPIMTPNRATDSLLDFVKQYKSDTSLGLLSPARVSSTWEAPCHDARALSDELASHLSPTTQRLRRTTCTTMETIMTYQSSFESSFGGSHAFRASWCSQYTRSAGHGHDSRNVHSHDEAPHAVRRSMDHKANASQACCTTSGDDLARAFVDSIVDLYDNSGGHWYDEEGGDKRDTLLEYNPQKRSSPRPSSSKSPRSRAAMHIRRSGSSPISVRGTGRAARQGEGETRRMANVTVARMMLPDTSKALLNTIREYSASRYSHASPARRTAKNEASSKRTTDGAPPTIRINRPESDSTLSRTSICPSETVSTICEAEVQHARVARKSVASIIGYAELVRVNASQAGVRQSFDGKKSLCSPRPWPSRPRNTSTSSFNSPGSQIMSEMPSFAWSDNRTSSIGTSYTIPSPCHVRQSTERKARLPSSSLILPQPRDRKQSMDVALETMQISQDDYPDSEYTLGVMRLFQPPKTVKQTEVFLQTSEVEYTPLTEQQQEQQQQPTAAIISLATSDLAQKLFSPTRQQADRGHWRRFCVEEASSARCAVPFGCDKTFGVVQCDDSGTVSLHDSDAKANGQDDHLDDSSLQCPSTFSSFLSFPTESSPIRNAESTTTMMTAQNGLLSRMSSFHSDASDASSSLSWSPVARFLPFTSSTNTPYETDEQGKEENIQHDHRRTSHAPSSLRIVVQSPTTDGYNSPS